MSKDLEAGPPQAPSIFQLRVADLNALNEDKNVAALEDLGGVQGLARKLLTDTANGLPQSEIDSNFDERRKEFSTNTYPEPPSKSLLGHFVDALGDEMLILLMILGAIAFIIGLAVPKEREENGWIEGLAIALAILLVSCVTAFNNWSKDKKFRELNKTKEDRKVKTVRAGKQGITSIFDINVGEIVLLDTGDQVPADGVFVEGFNLSTDESVMTGETDLIKKSHEKPFMLSGCQVAQGTGKMIVTAVGVHSEWGQTMSKLVVENPPTPLEEKLEVLASQIGKLGTIMAILILIVLIASWGGAKAAHGESWNTDVDLIAIIDRVIIAVTIVVVAVPEGLPLAVTISLAYSVKKMLADNNLVRKLVACETMGGATNICSDKTGTLTENRMTVTEGFFAGSHRPKVPEIGELNPQYVRLLGEAIAVNTGKGTAIEFKGENVRPEFQGNKTECALLYMLHKDFATSYDPIRKDFDHEYVEGVAQQKAIVNVVPFSSDRKRMSTIISHPDGHFVLFTKGAAEIVSGMCTTFLDENLQCRPITEEKRAELDQTIVKMASSGLRTICVAYREFESFQESFKDSNNPPENDITLIAIVGIKDPVRKEVPGAIIQCKKSGIFVRMVTGDNILTAKHIAEECGILSEDGIAIEGKDFRRMPDDEIDKILPKLQVMARSTPSDKYKLVKRLKDLGEVVAVTGDGTNDAPALKEADVGLSMGISGTEVAKEASDIVIMDDNFQSIVRAVLWGRSVYENIRKFLQFQLTVNIVALLVVFITGIAQFEPPLKAVQLLWVNLIMDTFAALALATEPPTPDLLDRMPYGRRDFLITPTMFRNCVGQAVYQLAILFGFFFGGSELFGLNADDEHEGVQLRTIIFNTFVFCQLFNEINARKINDENPFHNITKGYMFAAIWVFTAGAQALIVQYGSLATETTPITGLHWLACLIVGAFSLIVGVFLRQIPVPKNWPSRGPKKAPEVVVVSEAGPSARGTPDTAREVEELKRTVAELQKTVSHTEGSSSSVDRA